MAKVNNFSVEQIHGLAGQLDFYFWRGQAVCRKWPRHPKQPNTQAQKAARAAFIESRSDLRLVLAPVRALWPRDFYGKRQAWLDYYTACWLVHWKRYRVGPPVLFNFTSTYVV